MHRWYEEAEQQLFEHYAKRYLNTDGCPTCRIRTLETYITALRQVAIEAAEYLEALGSKIIIYKEVAELAAKLRGCAGEV